jgi:hypothetical protein
VHTHMLLVNPYVSMHSLFVPQNLFVHPKYVKINETCSLIIRRGSVERLGRNI